VGRRTTVVLAIRTPEFQAGRIFDAQALATVRASLQPIARPWLDVAREAATRGLALRTPDQLDDVGGALLVAYDWTPATGPLIAGGARPAVLLTFEPPVIAWSFYAHLRRLSRPFPHALVFAGARDRVAPGCCYHELRYPIVASAPAEPPRPWAERTGYLVMINSNKAIVRSTLRVFDRPREVSLKRELAAWRYRPIAHELYGERLRAIRFFARRGGFDLFGEGWRARHPQVDAATHALATSVHRGALPDDHKLSTLGRYRFALAIENTRFPGYVSEKLFDCLLAGTIPVYLGAPDVERYVAREAFVDARAFGGYAELDAHLRGMSPGEAEAHLAAGAAYLRSPAFEAFSSRTFARRLVDILGEVAG
jgi:Glycosyltransferase family 10 (fucosyltransferase) C-term